MRKLAYLSAAVLINISVQSQTDTAIVIARYDFSHVNDTTQPDKPAKGDMVLYIGARMSRYGYNRPAAATKGSASMESIPMSSVKSVSVINGNVLVDGVLLSEFSYNNSIYKDISTSKMVLLILPANSGKLFAVTDNTPAINWTIETETKIIQGMQCQKATARFKGRDYTAWFCSQLPYSNGPWKLGGLPGLILEAYDTKKEVVFTLTSFESAQDKSILVEIPANVIHTTPKEYKQYEDALNKNAAASSAGAGTLNGVAIRSVAPGAVNTGSIKRKQNNNPIEKENSNP
jgi:GLPGLI family protein